MSNPLLPVVRRTFLALALVLAGASSGAATSDALVDLQAYKGKVVLLDFWASWCGPCKESFPWMQRMQSRYAGQGLVVVAVNLDHERRLADQFLASQQPSFSVVFDPEGQLAERYRVNAMPSSFYIDRSGKVRHTHAGFRVAERADAEREIAALLAE